MGTDEVIVMEQMRIAYDADGEIVFVPYIPKLPERKGWRKRLWDWLPDDWKPGEWS